MATIQLVAGTKTYTNTAASDEYVMRFGSLNDITAYGGSYVIGTPPTALNPFPQEGGDKYVIELVNVIDPVTGQPKWPLVFPALALSTSANAPINNQLIGDNTHDTLNLRWLDQRSSGPLTVTINGFDATGKGTGNPGVQRPKPT